MRLLSTPTVSSVPGEYNYFSAVANVIITAVASRYCNRFVDQNWPQNNGPCVLIAICMLQ